MTTSVQETHSEKARSASEARSYSGTRSQSAPSFSQQNGERKTSSSSSPHLSASAVKNGTTKDVRANGTLTVVPSSCQVPSGSVQNYSTTVVSSPQSWAPAQGHGANISPNHHNQCISEEFHSSCKVAHCHNPTTIHNHDIPNVNTDHTTSTTFGTPVHTVTKETDAPPSEAKVNPTRTDTDQVNNKYKTNWIAILQRSKRPLLFERPWLSLLKAKAVLKDKAVQRSDAVPSSAKKIVCEDRDCFTSIDDPTTLSVTSSEVIASGNELPSTACESPSHNKDIPSHQNACEQKCPSHEGGEGRDLRKKTLFVKTLETSLDEHSLPEVKTVNDSVVSPRFDKDGSSFWFGNPWIFFVILTIILAFIIVLPFKNKSSDSSTSTRSSPSTREMKRLVGWMTATSVWAYILAVTGGVGNFVTIATICHQLILGHRRNSFYRVSPPTTIRLDGDTLLILHLSLCDFLYCTVNLPLTVFTYSTYPEGPGKDFCKGAALFRYLNAFVEWNTLALLAVERCIDLRRSHISRLFRPKTTLVLLLLIWVVSILLLLPTAIFDSLGYDNTTSKCDMDNESKVIFYTLETLVPCFLMSSGCISIIGQIYRNKQLLASTGMPPTVVAERGRKMWRSSAMTLGLLLLFLACVIPICVYNVIYAIPNRTICVEAGIIIFAFYWIQFGVNFLIYAASNAAYRKAYLVFFSAVTHGLLKPCCPYLEENPEGSGQPRLTPPSSVVGDPSSV